MSDLSFDNLLVEKVDNNLVFKPSDHNSNRGSLTIKDWFKTGHGYNHKIEQIVDKNGRKLILDKLETHFNGTQKANLLGYTEENQNENNLFSLKTELGKIISSAGNFGLTKQESTSDHASTLNNVDKIISSASNFATSQMSGLGMGLLSLNNADSTTLISLAKTA